MQQIVLLPDDDGEIHEDEINHVDQEVESKAGKGTRRTVWKVKENSECEIPEWKGNVLTPDRVKEPIEYFLDIFTKSLLERIVKQTNLHAV